KRRAASGFDNLGAPPGCRLHLLEPRNRPREFLAVIIPGVDFSGSGLRGGDEPDMRVIERVDQQDEAFGGISLGREQRPDAFYEDELEGPRERKIVGGPARRITEIGKSKPRRTARSLRNGKLASEHFEAQRIAFPHVGELLPQLLQLGIAFGPKRGDEGS